MSRFTPTRAVATAAFILLFAVPIPAELVDLARNGEWTRIFQIAQLRSQQLPLNSGESLVAARAARQLGDSEAELKFLAAAGNDSTLRQVAQIETARVLLSKDIDHAARLALPIARRAETPQLRAEAIAILENCPPGQIATATRHRIAGTRVSGSRATRRRFELIQAYADAENRKSRLVRLLEHGTNDLQALRAAQDLEAFSLDHAQQWLVAKTLYRHALYEQAATRLGRLEKLKTSEVPRWELAFLLGRCAFRSARWDDAIAWYEKALHRAKSAERRATLQVHIGRSHELAGRMDKAIEAARGAVITKASDNRRLFLARLRLVNAQPELATVGIRQIRSRSARARGELMLALSEAARGSQDAALRRFKNVRSRPWRAPASVFAAAIETAKDEPEKTLETLSRYGWELDEFWAANAREIVRQLDGPLVDAWRSQIESAIAASSGWTHRKKIATWARLEVDPVQLERIRTLVDSEIGLKLNPDQPPAPTGLAGRLWQLGLTESAVRWNPGALPRNNASETLWTAAQLLENGSPQRAISAAYDSWKMSAAHLPTRVLPPSLRLLYHPLPYPETLRAAALQYEIPWQILAGVAREESKWDHMVLSRVGARGLLQLMPATAQATAARLDIDNPEPEDLFDPALSLQLGAAELGRLRTVYEGNMAAAIAAYNAGQQQVDLWLQQCPENASPAHFVAAISFKETRSYTAQVLASAETYTVLYSLD